MHKICTAFRYCLVTGTLLAVGAAAQAPDNTATNKRDRADHSVTADKQGRSGSDRELARKIRKDIVADKSLSTYAHNVKVIVKDGSVTLRGPVRSDDEKGKVSSIASRHAGEGKVVNEIQISPSK